MLGNLYIRLLNLHLARNIISFHRKWTTLRNLQKHRQLIDNHLFLFYYSNDILMQHNEIFTGVPIYTYIFIIFWKLFKKIMNFEQNKSSTRVKLFHLSETNFLVIY